eukprot:CAMPEP_0171370466 /NCGR_PEP_ID=MMETSP0879-20121228/8049_1 /TAXON_ID=67004 /ORGANISM="Thalassiosira weissflogii, Strain CCMP1336" /LENGTH=216 /DNA_ID=CAMNT_0011878943 /DNA_START=69 /DNA_END=719 /DNA_ORIENTATION=+
MNDTTLPKNPRRRRPPEGKVRPGFGLNDWLTLLRRSSDLAQRKGAPLRRDITLEEVKKHDRSYDGWMILRGKVYNIGPYLAYHPGGSAILEKVCGRDGTELFDRYHAWVNIENLIGPLLLGYLKVEKNGGDDDERAAGHYLKGVAATTSGPMSAGNIGNAVILPSGVADNATNSNFGRGDAQFAIPAPRPPRGANIPTLLSPGDGDEEDESDEVKF